MKAPRIIVVGDLIIDHYLWGDCERISSEAPVQVIDIKNETVVLGGAGNVVNNLIALGAEVTVLSAIGDDISGHELIDMLQKLLVIVLVTVEHGRKTSRKTRIVASNQQVIRYDTESVSLIDERTEQRILADFQEKLVESDIVLLSDYGKGVLTPTLTQQIIHAANTVGIKVLVDPKGNDYSKYANAYLLTPNKREAAQATGIIINSYESLQLAITKLKIQINLTISIITLSDEGIAVFDGANLSIEQTVAREVFDVTGAGDTVLAALGYKLAQECTLLSSVEFANLAAAVVVAKVGCATATVDEISEYAASLQKHFLGARIKTRTEMISIVEMMCNQHRKIIFTNGCFDILHRGHVSYLREARSLGDILIVGLNNDASVKRLKGESRPINSEEDRALVLSALNFVDYVVIFEEDTPYELIRAIRPDILVKGGDYHLSEVVGSDLVSSVKLIPYLEGKSTTSIIAAINSGAH